GLLPLPFCLPLTIIVACPKGRLLPVAPLVIEAPGHEYFGPIVARLDLVPGSPLQFPLYVVLLRPAVERLPAVDQMKGRHVREPDQVAAGGLVDGADRLREAVLLGARSVRRAVQALRVGHRAIRVAVGLLRLPAQVLDRAPADDQ